MAVQFAILEGADVIAFSSSKNHLDVAKKLGAIDTMAFSENQEFLDELKKRHGMLDAAIVFAPADIIATDVAIKSVKRGGLIVIATVGKNPTFFAF